MRLDAFQTFPADCIYQLFIIVLQTDLQLHHSRCVRMPENISQCSSDSRVPHCTDGKYLLPLIHLSPCTLMLCLTPRGTSVCLVQPRDDRSGLRQPGRVPDRKCFCCVSPAERSEVTQLQGNSVGGCQAVLMCHGHTTCSCVVTGVPE